MSVSFYMDVHVPLPICRELRRRDITVLRAQEDGAAEFSDPELLDRANSLRHVMFSRDADFLIEAARRQRAGVVFMSLVFAHQEKATIHQCIGDLELIAKAMSIDELAGQVIYIPL